MRDMSGLTLNCEHLMLIGGNAHVSRSLHMKQVGGFSARRELRVMSCNIVHSTRQCMYSNKKAGNEGLRWLSTLIMCKCR